MKQAKTDKKPEPKPTPFDQMEPVIEPATAEPEKQEACGKPAENMEAAAVPGQPQPTEPPPQEPAKASPPATPTNPALNEAGGLRPSNFEEMWKVANLMARSGMVPDKFVNNPAGIMAVMQTAIERKLNPFSSLQNMANINGKVSGYGDLPMGEVIRSGELEYVKEFWLSADGKPIDVYDFKTPVFAAACITKRAGWKEEIIRVFTIEESKQANLLGNPKKDVWKQYTKRMLQMRARGWALKDNFADIVAGLPMPEYDEHEPEPVALPTEKGLAGRLNARVADEKETVQS